MTQMTQIGMDIKRLMRAGGRFLREVSGEADYERYCRHLREHHVRQSLPSRQEFYLESLRRRYSRPSRCC